MFITKCISIDYFLPGTVRERLYHELRLESLVTEVGFENLSFL